MGVLSKISHFYDRRYKTLLIIPIILIILSLAVVGMNYYQHGDFIQKGISLKGGTTVTIQMEGISVTDLSNYLESKFGAGETSVRELTSAGKNVGVIVDAADVNADSLIAALKEKLGANIQYSAETIGESLGASFFTQALIAVLFAFVLMSLVVLIYFRALVPSFYVVLSAAFDILFAVALVDLFNIKVGTSGIAAFLMLIGYSVDTDILLTARVLKNKEGTVFERIKGSIRTGLTMTLAAVAAALIAYFLTPSEVLKQIMLILFFGLIADMPSTWLMNSGLLRIYIEKKHNKEQHKSAHGEN